MAGFTGMTPGRSGRLPVPSANHEEQSVAQVLSCLQLAEMPGLPRHPHAPGLSAHPPSSRGHG